MNDQHFLQQALQLALAAEAQGNLPIGALLVLDNQVIAEGRNALLHPRYHPGRHAEIEALRQVPVELWPQATAMTCYTTLEPCIMCYGSLLLHGVGRIVFGALDLRGGASSILHALPPYYQAEAHPPEWVGPLLEAECHPLYERARDHFITLPCGGNLPP